LCCTGERLYETGRLQETSPPMRHPQSRRGTTTFACRPVRAELSQIASAKPARSSFACERCASPPLGLSVLAAGCQERSTEAVSGLTSTTSMREKMFMSICTRSTCVLITTLVLSTGVMAQGSGTDEKRVGKIEDLAKPNIEDIRRIKDTLQKSQGQIDDMANRNIAPAVRKFNRGLRNATRDINRAVGEFEQTYSAAAQKELLKSISEIYSDLLGQLDEIPGDFLDRARDVYGNAISKGERISKENLDKTEKDWRFKEKLLDQKISRLRKLHDSGSGADVDIAEARRLIKDVIRLEAMIRRGKQRV